ncbi:MAG: M1 family aminopeptidase [Pseudomonadales bacterium]
MQHWGLWFDWGRRALWAVRVVGFLLAGWLAVATVAVARDAGSDQAPLGRLGDAVVPLRYALQLTIDPRRDSFSGIARIDVDIRAPALRFWMHGADLDVAAVTLTTGGGRIAARYRQVDPSGVASIDLDQVPDLGPARLEIRYRADFSDTPEGLYRVRTGGNAYAFSHFQASAARRVFPSFDEPAFKVPFEIEVIAPLGHHVITATAETEVSATRAQGRAPMQRWRFTPTLPMPTYLLAFAIGPFDVVTVAPLPANAVRAWSVPMRGVAVKGRGGELATALGQTKPLVEAIEAYLDLPLPVSKLDLIAVPDFAAGAMENVGAITYREDTLLIGREPAGVAMRRFVSVHAHELAHQWFGNWVSPRWWDDLWLNEAFASWLGARTAHRVFPGLGLDTDTLDAALAAMVDDDLPSARRVRQPVETPHDVANAFDSITYSKGAAVLRMFEHWVGEDRFRAALRSYVGRFAGDVADSEDFIVTLERFTQEPGVRAMIASFLDQPGTPLIETRIGCSNGRAEAQLRQRRSLPLGAKFKIGALWDVPVCLRYPTDDGRTATRCERVHKRSHVVPLSGAACPSWIMPNADATGYYRFAFDAEGWRAAFEHLDAFTPAEARMLFASLSSGFRAGEVSVASLLSGIRRAAEHPDWEVSTAQLGNLIRFKAFYADASPARAALERLIVELYHERLQALGIGAKPKEPEEVALNRRVLARAVTLYGADPHWRERLRPFASRYLASPTRYPRGIDPELLEIALAVELANADSVTFDAQAAAVLVSDDPQFRRRMLGALAMGATSDRAPTLFALLKAQDLHDQEAVRLVRRMASNPALDDALWDWMGEPANLDTLLTRFPERRRGSVIGLAAVACDQDRARALGARFATRVDAWPGGPRALRQAQEAVQRCAALRGRYQRSLAKALGADG